MKMVNKSKCIIASGQIAYENSDGSLEIMGLDNVVYSMMHILDEQVQKAKYLLAQPKFQEAPSLKKFKKKSSVELPLLDKPSTPAIDMQVMQALSIMSEIDERGHVNDVNSLIKELEPLFNWVDSEYICDSGCTPDRIDLPEIGNPLELTKEKLVEFCELIVNAVDIEGVED